MSNIPKNLKYSKDHEWVKVDGNVATVGITDYAQEQLGDVVFVELPEPEKGFTAGEEFGVVESVKSVSSLLCPVSGIVKEMNAELLNSPQFVNQEPYDKAWMIKVEMTAPAETDALLSAADYQKLTESK